MRLGLGLGLGAMKPPGGPNEAKLDRFSGLLYARTLRKLQMCLLACPPRSKWLGLGLGLELGLGLGVLTSY